ncbi:MAG: hypothetical protein MI976_18080, partial [Pseudomonadales bacterium]|nr:hypothetical protein [Pseudomonadales bacterium]
NDFAENANQGFWHRLSGTSRFVLVAVVILITLWAFTSNLQKSRQLDQLSLEVAQLKDSIKTEDAKAEATQSELEQELQDAVYEQQLQNNEWLANFEWAVNQDDTFAWNEKPFNDNLAKKVGVIANRLQAAGFDGTLILTSHLGDFCLTTNGDGTPALPEEGQLISACNINQLPEQQAEALGLEQSMAFNHFLAAFEIQFENSIQLELDTVGNQAPLMDYPDQEPDLLAEEWNQVATQNNRVAIEFRPFEGN